MKSESMSCFIKGENIMLRALEMADIDDGYLFWVNDLEVNQFLEVGRFPTSREQLAKIVTMTKEGPPSTIMFAVVERNSGRYIGNVKLGPIDWINRNAEYGRLIGEKMAHGKGYGSELTRLLLRYAFNSLGLHKVTAGVVQGNLAAMKSNQNAGLEIEGTIKDGTFLGGRFKDVLRMGITKTQWEQRGNGSL